MVKRIFLKKKTFEYFPEFEKTLVERYQRNIFFCSLKVTSFAKVSAR